MAKAIRFILNFSFIPLLLNSGLYAQNEPPPKAMPRPRRQRDASADEIDRLTTYATILGRAIGCGINVESEMRRVGKWIDKRFPPGTQRHKTYFPIFLEGIRHHATQQKEGKSPDSCGAVRDQIRKFPWP